MVKRIALLTYCIIAFLSPLPSRTIQGSQACSSCSLVQRVLQDAQELKTGLARKDIEAHNFVEAGGMLFRDRTRYVSKECDYIEVEIEFNLDPWVERDFSDNDTIKDISQLVIHYPVKD